MIVALKESREAHPAYYWTCYRYGLMIFLHGAHVRDSQPVRLRPFVATPFLLVLLLWLLLLCRCCCINQ
jgi:hypothetical protein